MVFKKVIFLLFFSSVFFFQAFSQEEDTINVQTGMLILGSADQETTKKRVEVGYNLYNSDLEFDYIIVAGGCGAHGSKICEAEIMEKMLLDKGVPEELIFKEDKSRTSAQNYCYSKKLKRADGTQIITEDDLLYVVSNHWHAISVAGCFTQQDAVNAQYHIEGSITPKETDKTDYVNIFKNCTENEFFCTALLWPLVDASYYRPLKTTGERYYFTEDVQHHETQGVDKMQTTRLSDVGPVLPSGWEKGIDAAFFDERENKIYYFKGKEYLRFSSNRRKIDKNYPKKIEDWIENLPKNWEGGHIDASFLDPNERKLYLFKGTEYLVVSVRNSQVEPGYPKLIKDFVQPWPFQWAKGDLDAAHFDFKNNKVFLFRGKEVLRASFGETLNADEGYPSTTPLVWPEQILGPNPNLLGIFAGKAFA